MGPGEAIVAVALGGTVIAGLITLGGIIKYDQDDLAKAEADLKEAIRIDPAQCVAHWYLGLINFKKAVWPETASRFGVCASCYQKSAEENVRRL